MSLTCVLVTGGCGFIASNFIHKLLSTGKYRVINLDKLNYCANQKNISQTYRHEYNDSIQTDLKNYRFYKGDINNTDLVREILNSNQVDIIYHFAAQTHVDQSFGNSTTFVVDNVLGTSNLLECAREYGKLKRFIHVSTDEVYGSITGEKEELVMKYGIYDPTNPYAATKAAAELMVQSYNKSYGIPTIITRSNNVYGPRQYWEKIIPKFIYLLSKGKKCTVYGDGSALRKYLFVEDAADAYLTVMEKGIVGEIYEMDSNTEFSALQMTHKLISVLKSGDNPNDWIDFVEDRHFHDVRYIVNPKTLFDLGWTQKTSFDEGFEKTIAWYTKYAIPEKHWDYDDSDTLKR